MKKEFFLTIPKMGESVTDAVIQKWLVKEGDIISKDAPYIEVSTDKVDSEIPSPYHCRLIKILVLEGKTIAIGDPIATIEMLGNESLYVEPNVKNNKTLLLEKEHTKNIENIKLHHENIQLSPLVRKIFFEHGLNISEAKYIQGTGANLRISKEDAIRYIHNRENIIKNTFLPIAQPSIKPEELKWSVEDGDLPIEFDKMRTIIAKHMSDSILKSAHCTSFSEIDVTNLVQWRDEIKNDFDTKHLHKITYTHIFMYLIIDVLRQFPKMNSWQNKNGYIQKKQINLGFATALPDGNLIVPNIKSLETKSLENIVSEVHSISQNAKENKLQATDIQNGTFTMSNTGIFGSLMGTPIINQPQVAIMALGEILKTPSVIEDNGKDIIAVRKKMIVSLSYDHRIIDGAYAASFLKQYKKSIENFQNIHF